VVEASNHVQNFFISIMRIGYGQFKGRQGSG